MAVSTPPLQEGSARGSASPRRVALAGLVGTTIEWYDFVIYGTAAALVFGPQFFPSGSEAVSTLAALSTFAVGFVARPLGGALMGHLGDRIGRKQMLVASLLLMGGATAAVGLLPNYASIGVAAPILLVILRLLQGVGVGGEWGGAVLMSLEHAPASRRTLYAAFPTIGLPIGVILASSTYLGLRLGMDAAAFAAWGWRIPFLASLLLVAFGFVLRLKLDESPEFVRAREARELSSAPLPEVLRRMPVPLLLAAGVVLLTAAFGNVVQVFGLSYVSARGTVSPTTLIGFTILSAVVWAVLIPFSARLAERVGRRKVLVWSVSAMSVWGFPYFLLLDSGSPALIAVAYLGFGVLAGLTAGPQAATIADTFPPALRYSGSAVAYAIGVGLGGGLSPLVSTALIANGGSAMSVAVYVLVVGVVSVACIAALRPHDARVASQPPSSQLPRSTSA